MSVLEKASIKEFVQELLERKGYFILPQVFSREEIIEARNLVIKYSDNDETKETHFQGAHKEELNLQKRVWNLLNKGDVFVKMVENSELNNIIGEFLGSEFHIGSIAANRILPGGPGQEPHKDYPYWDMYNRETFPHNINYTVPLNCQSLIMLDDFTEENGATAIAPGSQKECRYPGEGEFFDKMERLIGKAGDVAVFYGMCWHCAMPNRSDKDRSAILIQYLPKFIIPLEDQKRGVNQKVLDKSSPRLKQLLGYGYPYPKLLDEEEGKSRIGRNENNK